MFSLQILQRMEALLRENYGRPDMVLADHFHLIAGTSVGAILATFLSWGWAAEKLNELFDRELHNIFSRARWVKVGGAAFRRGPLRELLQREFCDPETGEPALYGTRQLKSWLLIVVRNLSTGSAWPLVNHPEALYNRLTTEGGEPNLGSNLRLPLWQLVRGSTAAPWFFPPERVSIAPGQIVEFIDGGVTAYNNPSVISFLMATLNCFPLQWPKGEANLQIVSVGTGRVRAHLSPLQRFRFGRLGLAGAVPAALIESASHEQDVVMRSLGRCIHGGELDSEMGTLAGEHAVADAFRYCRYNRPFTVSEITDACAKYRTRFALSSVKLAPWLKQQGHAYAQEHVKIEHLI